jgi:hypothetical protein
MYLAAGRINHPRVDGFHTFVVTNHLTFPGII